MKRIALFALLCALPAVCQDKPRHVDFTQILTGADAKPIEADAKAQIPLTLGDAALFALEAQAQGEETTGADKFKRDELARRVYNRKDVVLAVEEVAMIKERIGKVYGPLVVGAAWRLLDPAQK